MNPLTPLGTHSAPGPQGLGSHGSGASTQIWSSQTNPLSQSGSLYNYPRSTSGTGANTTDVELEEGVRDVETNFGDIIEYTREREMIIATKEAD